MTAIPLFDPEPPRARGTDPKTSALAAKALAPGNAPLVREIRAALQIVGHPLCQHDIAQMVCSRNPGRWDEGTVRSGCARAGLFEVGADANRRGRAVVLWWLEAVYQPWA